MELLDLFKSDLPDLWDGDNLDGVVSATTQHGRMRGRRKPPEHEVFIVTLADGEPPAMFYDFAPTGIGAVTPEEHFVQVCRSRGLPNMRSITGGRATRDEIHFSCGRREPWVVRDVIRKAVAASEDQWEEFLDAQVTIRSENPLQPPVRLGLVRDVVRGQSGTSATLVTKE